MPRARVRVRRARGSTTQELASACTRARGGREGGREGASERVSGASEDKASGASARRFVGRVGVRGLTERQKEGEKEQGREAVCELDWTTQSRAMRSNPDSDSPRIRAPPSPTPPAPPPPPPPPRIPRSSHRPPAHSAPMLQLQLHLQPANARASAGRARRAAAPRAPARRRARGRGALLLVPLLLLPTPIPVRLCRSLALMLMPMLKRSGMTGARTALILDQRRSWCQRRLSDSPPSQSRSRSLRDRVEVARACWTLRLCLRLYLYLHLDLRLRCGRESAQVRRPSCCAPLVHFAAAEEEEEEARWDDREKSGRAWVQLEVRVPCSFRSGRTSEGARPLC